MIKRIDVCSAISGYEGKKPEQVEYHENDVIWQHMKVEFAQKLLLSKSLYFRRINEYKTDEYRLFEFYTKDYETIADNRKKIIKQAEEEHMQSNYVSCWFRKNKLDPAIFDRFTKDGNGVAFRTTVKKLIEAMQAADCGDITFYYGGVMYHNEVYFDGSKGLFNIAYGFYVKPGSPDISIENEFRVIQNNFEREYRETKYPHIEVTTAQIYLPVSIGEFFDLVAIKKDNKKVEDELKVAMDESGYMLSPKKIIKQKDFSFFEIQKK